MGEWSLKKMTWLRFPRLTDPLCQLDCYPDIFWNSHFCLCPLWQKILVSTSSWETAWRTAQGYFVVTAFSKSPCAFPELLREDPVTQCITHSDTWDSLCHLHCRWHIDSTISVTLTMFCLLNNVPLLSLEEGILIITLKSWQAGKSYNSYMGSKDITQSLTYANAYILKYLSWQKIF